MVGVSVAGPGRAVVRLPRVGAGPPWWVPLHLPALLVTVALWVAAVAGVVGVGAGLVAVARGARPRARLLVVAALVVTGVLAVLPAAGSTDTLDYAAYGRMVAIGHDPYVMTPRQLRLSGDPVGAFAPKTWSHKHSVYGPLATVEQGTAAILGGTSAARITFWLKLWNAFAFAVVVLALDWMLREDPGRRARAHLLWSLNPLLLWGLVAAGHVDAVAAALAFLGLLLVTRERAPQTAVRSGLAAGALVGAAADVKITFVLYGLGIAWAARKSVPTLVAAAGAALAVLVPSYLWFGPPAIAVLAYRDSSATGDNLYQLFSRPFGLASLPALTLVTLPLLVGVGWLLLRRLPDGFPARPAVRPTLALSLAWLLVWPYQRPWYDAMALCLLALYPPSRLDWPILARLGTVSLCYLPGMPRMLPAGLPPVLHEAQIVAVPLIRLATLAAVIALCLTGAWTARPGGGLPAAGAAVSGRNPAGPARGRAGRAPVGGRPGPSSGAAGPPGRCRPDPG